MKTLLSLCFLSNPLSTALTLPLTACLPADAEWSVYNYTQGSSPGGCEYGFNIARGSSPTDQPNFSTYCPGSNISYKLQPCENLAISSNEISGFQNFTVVVQRVFETLNGAREYVMGTSTFQDVDGNYSRAF
jgi:hypothetical protein